MLRFVLDKLLQKKWMVCSLLTGTILFIAVGCLNPIYVGGAMERMLPDRLEQAAFENDQYPLMAESSVALNIEGKDFFSARDGAMERWQERIGRAGLPVALEQICYQGREQIFTSDFEENNGLFMRLAVACMPDMENHLSLIDGELYSKEAQEDGIYTCIVSRSVFSKYKMVLGQVITFDALKDEKGQNIRFKIVGVFTQGDLEDNFWGKSAESYNTQCFVSEKVFGEVVCPAYNRSGDGADTRLIREARALYDYSKLKPEEVPAFYEISGELEQENVKINGKEVLRRYFEDKEKTERTIAILQVPTMVLLALFIFMVAAKMLDMEQNEISVLKSRGVSGVQIVFLYFFQSLFITLASLLLGLLLACLMALAVGYANSFMEFVSRESLPLRITGKVWGQLILSACFCIAVMTIPVIPRCRVTIVEQKRKNGRHKKVFWKRFYLDVIGTCISLYIFYNFRSQLPSIRDKIRMGESVDPTLFLGSSLFILSLSLLLTRLIPCIVSLIYRIGRKKWSIASYTAFLQSTRNREKQGFIMIFLTCTIALGIFNANTARTINHQEEMTIRYRDGADLVLQEEFPNNHAAVKYLLVRGMEAGEIVYTEPDPFKYEALENDIRQMTKVYRQTKEISLEKVSSYLDVEESAVSDKVSLERGEVVLMGIETEEFGKTAYMPDGILDKHWYHYLNAMAENPYGVLMSSNARDKLGLSVGDSIAYTRFDEENRTAGMGRGVIVGFVDYFPGFSSERYVKNSNGSYTVEDVYLVVAGFDMVENFLGAIPYERWIANRDSNRYIYDFSEENEIDYAYFSDSDNNVVKMKNDPVFQETNGLLTIGFLVALLICCIGFLIFQIMGIKERELIFGVCRAMGMTYGEMKKMLVLEQFLTSFPAAAGGVLTGILATWLYAPLIQVAYESGTNVWLPVEIICNAKDMLQLGIILILVFILCIGVIARNISRMKIAQALKLGEE